MRIPSNPPPNPQPLDSTLTDDVDLLDDDVDLVDVDLVGVVLIDVQIPFTNAIQIAFIWGLASIIAGIPISLIVIACGMLLFLVFR